MNYGEYIKIDRALNDYELKYDDFVLTKLLRDEIVYQIRSQNNQGNPKVNLSKGGVIRLLSSLFRSIPNLFKNRKYWVFSNAERRKIINGHYVDRVASIVSETYPGDVLYIENAILESHKRPTKDTILSESILQLVGFIIYKLSFNKKKIELSGNIINLEQEFNVSLNVLPAIQKFLGQYYVMRAFLYFKVKPETVFMVYPTGYYGYLAVFKDKNIPVVELQHGIIYKEHPSYNYSLTPEMDVLRPDFIFTYGKNDKTCLKNLGFLSPKSICSVGSYFIAKQESKDTLVTQYLQSIVEKIAENKKITVVTTTIKDMLEMLEWSKMITEKYKDIHVLIMPRTTYNSSEKKFENINILDPNKTNIYEAIKIAAIHVTKSSTCSLESLYFDKISLIYEPIMGTSMYRRNYSDINNLNYFTTYEEFYALTDFKVNKELNNINLLFERDVFENFKTAMLNLNLGDVSS